MEGLSQTINPEFTQREIRSPCVTEGNTEHDPTATKPNNETTASQNASHAEISHTTTNREATDDQHDRRKSGGNSQKLNLGSKNILIVGDSIIKGIDIQRFDKTGDTFINTIRGGTIEHIANFISRLKPKALNIVVCLMGTNNLQGCLTIEIVTQIKSLVQRMKIKFPTAKVVLSTIINHE